jgi:hypothetical protein
MKTKINLFSALFGIIALSAIIVFLPVSCSNDPEDPPPAKEIPAELRNTTWVKDGDSVTFTKTTVKVKPANGSEQTFTLKNSVTVEEINQTTFYFSDDKLSNYIVLRDNTITSVNLGGVNKSNFVKDYGSGNVQHDDVIKDGMKFKYAKYIYNESNEIIYEVNGYGVTSFDWGTTTNVVIPDKINNIPVTYIGSSSFCWDYFYNKFPEEYKLTSVTIPNSVKYIRNYAFAYNQLTSVTIPNSVTKIGYNAFSNNQLTSVTIPNSVTEIGSMVFLQNQLTSVTIPNSVTSIGLSAFMDNKLTSVIIPNSVTTIETTAFMDNQLTSVTIPNSVTSIGSWAFVNNQLTSVIIPNSVTKLGNNAFGSSITSITIGSNVDCETDGDGFEQFYIDSGKAAGIYTRTSTSIFAKWTRQ